MNAETMKKIKIFLMCLLMILTFSSFGNQKVNFTIENIDSESKPLVGFKYELLGDNFKETIDLTKENTKVVKLDKGDYVLKEIKTLDGYEKSKDYKFSIDEKSDGDMKYLRKHIKIVPHDKGRGKKTNKYVKTNVSFIGCLVLFIFGLALIISPFAYKRLKKDEK